MRHEKNTPKLSRRELFSAIAGALTAALVLAAIFLSIFAILIFLLCLAA